MKSVTEVHWIPYVDSQADQAAQSTPTPAARSRTAQHKNGKRQQRRHTVSKIIWRTLLVLLATAVGVVVGAYVMASVPDPAKLALPKAGTIYFADGTTPIGTLTTPHRTVVPAEKIAPVMRAAVIASEDPLFERRPAANFAGMASRWWESLWGGGGASEESLTDKFVQAASANAKAPVFEVLRDAFLPVKIDHALSKEQIVAAYLNTAYFGRGAYGVEAGAQAYFGVSAQSLSTAQAVLLAAVLPAPSAWDPAYDSAQAHKQFEAVKVAMVKAGVLSQSAADAVEFPAVLPYSGVGAVSGANGYLVSMVREELLTVARLAPAVIERGGISVVTTIDAATQQKAVNAVNAAANGRPANFQTGLFAMNPKNGEVLAAYGGADFAKRRVNNATDQRVPAGSPFKIFGLIENFENDLGVNNTYYHYISGYVYGENYLSIPDVPGGVLSIADATKFNINDVFVRLGGDVGTDTIMKRAVALGIPAQASGLTDKKANLLGAARVTAREMARAYAAVANNGVLTMPHAVREVRDAAGAVIYTGGARETQVMKAETAKLSTYLLQTPFTKDGVAYANGHAFAERHPAAGLPSNGVDTEGAWFVGYTPSIVTAVVGTQLGADGTLAELQPFGGAENVAGSGYPLQVWSAFMQAASAHKTAEKFPDVTELVKKTTKTNPAPGSGAPEEGGASQGHSGSAAGGLAG